MAQFNLTIDSDQLIESIQDSNMDNLTKSMLVLILNKTMEAERDAYINAQPYERSDERRDYRNGYYERDYITLNGKIRLRVPRTRSGKFSTEVFEKYKRMDQAFILSLLEMYVNGVSTRNVTNIVKKLTGDDISKSLVSSLTPKLDEQVRAFKNRKLDHSRFDYVYADAMYIKVRENDSVVSKGVYIALGVNEDHKREVLGFDILGQESTQNWTNFFQDLKARGLEKPKLIISDAHEGLKTAIKEQFIGTTWQRCVAHFIRNIIKKMPRKNSGDNNLLISRIFRATNQDEARARKREFEELVGDDKRYEAALEILDNGFEDAIPYLLEHEAYQVSLKTTNTLERFNRELRRRDRTIGIYPNSQSAQRLMGALLLDQHEEWLEMKRAFLKIPSLSYQHLQV